MIWGCMSWYGAGGMQQVNGIMDSDQLVSIFADNLLPTLDQVTSGLGLSARSQVIFQQDNDTKHKSVKTRAWLASNNLKTLKWPSQSPDLNPIEHLWGQVKRQLGAYPANSKEMIELWERVDYIWSNIDVELCQSLILSMPSRVEAVLKAKGGPTKF